MASDSALPALPPPSPDPATDLPAALSPAPALAPAPRAASPADESPPVTPTWKRRNRSGSLAAQVSDAQGDSDAGMGGEISATELRQEMETLLSLRRRSLSQPAVVDPDLPPSSPSPPSTPSRPQLSIAITPPNSGSLGGGPVSPTAPVAAETGTLIRRKSSTTGRLPSDHPLPSVPPPSPPAAPGSSSGGGLSPTSADGVSAAHTSQELFWLPASLHPELAPQEFKAFIREQTRPDNLARRTSSAGRGGYGGGRVDRKKSMLRGEYKPMKDDGVGEGSDRVEGPSRLNFEELTISDLQRLEQLAARAEAEGTTDGEGEGERLGRVLRRSLSLNPNHVAAAAAEGGHLDTIHSGPSHLTDNPDNPLIVPPPGQILRRSARTKIRKAGLVGDGGGHRFGPSRRVRVESSQSDEFDAAVELSLDSVDSDEIRAASPSDSGESDPPDRRRTRTPPPEPPEIEYYDVAPVLGDIGFDSPAGVAGWLGDEPGPYEAKAALPDSPDLPSPPRSDAPLPPTPASQTSISATSTGPSPSSADYDWATHHQPQASSAASATVPTPAPLGPIQIIAAPDRSTSRPLPASQPASTSPRPGSVRDGKEKKSGWARLGLGAKAAASTEDDDGSSKKKKGKGKESEREAAASAAKLAAADKERERERERVQEREREKEKEKEKEFGFFGGLFGGKKKAEQDANQQPTPTTPPPEIRTPPPPPTASGALLPNGQYNNFYRLPIHVERAVYRLSHIKLANPRRPLYEQVLISNLMFWYLSIINKPAAPAPAAPVPVPAPIEVAEPKRTLNKAARGPGRSSSEMPVKQPQYEQQNRQIDQEYGLPDHQQSSPSPAPSSSRAPLMPRSVSNPTPNLSAGRPEPVSPSPASASASGDLAPARPTMTRAPSSRDSYPPERPVAVSSYPKHDRGFEVTSRSHREVDHRRRASSGAEGDRPVSSASSFDESDIFDAYSSLPSSNSGPVEWTGQDYADPAAPASAPPSTTISPRKRGESLNAVKSSGPYRTLSPTVELSPTHSSGETQAARSEVSSRRGQASVGGDARGGSAREYR